MKIACIHQGYELYGSDRSFLQSLRALRIGIPSIKITVVIPKKGLIYDYVRSLADEVIILEEMAVLRKNEIKTKPLQFLIKLCRQMPLVLKIIHVHDVVYINTMVILDFIIAVAWFKKIKIIHVREIPTGLQVPFFSLLLRFSATNVIFNSRSTKNSFKYKNSKKCHTIYNGVAGFVHLSPPTFNPEQFKLLMLSRILPFKGHTLLIEAVNILPQNIKQRLHVKMVGDIFQGYARYKQSLFDLIALFNLENIIEILPFTNEQESLIAWSDAMIIPSTRPESFGRVAIEGMSAGRPIIASNLGGLVEIVHHKETGLLFKPGDTNDLSTTLLCAIDYPEEMRNFGLRGKQVFFERFTEEIYLSNFINCIKVIEKQ